VVTPEELFSEYPYFSSYSATWREHNRVFATNVVSQMGLSQESLVVEVASNDGYLLRHFLSLGIPVLGIEPAANVAKASISAGIPTEVAFFSSSVAKTLTERGYKCDLLIANNVFGHVPRLQDFCAGLALMLKPEGVLVLEFPHLLRLLKGVQFDTIYHEHIWYFSLLTAERILAQSGLSVFDVEQVATHGGSLRVWASLSGNCRPSLRRVEELRKNELSQGLAKLAPYESFAQKAHDCRDSVTAFFETAQSRRLSVAAYGAAAKGSTLLNFCGIDSGDVDYVADRNVHKQGMLLPGSHVPVVDPSAVFATKPSYLLILPWNLREEITGDMAAIRSWGGQFVVPIPSVKVIP